MSGALPRESRIELLRHQVVEKIRTFPYVAAPDPSSPSMVVEYKAGNIESEYDLALARTGLCIMVGIETARESGAQTTRIEWLPAKLYVHVIESPEHQSGDPKPPGAWAYAEELVADLKMCALPDNTFPMISEKPLEQLPHRDEGFLVVGFELEIPRLYGNSRSTTN